MKFNSLTPMLWTENLEETIQFYTNILGFICGEKNQDWGWAAIHKDDIEIMFALPNKHVDYNGINFTGSFYFNISNVETLWNKVKNSCKIVYPIENFDWDMREFAIYDTTVIYCNLEKILIKTK